MTTPLPFDAPALAGQLLARLADEPVRVHAITNAAAQVLTANLLLAAGGIPSLTTAPDEVPAFTARAGALLVNLGTLDGDRRASIPWAIATARAQHRPWVLDPVFVDASSSRLELARLCLAGGPAVLRCNEAEFTALAEAPPEPDALKAYARDHAVVLALTGPVDRITDGERLIRIGNGHPLMARVTAMGCAATALVAAFTALHSDAFEATVAALLVTGIAGEIAAEAAAGPGSFAPAFLDALASLEAPVIVSRARLP